VFLHFVGINCALLLQR